MNEKEVITISISEYNQLVEDSLRLEYLERWGVDNWCGYSDAIGDMYDEYEEYRPD